MPPRPGAPCRTVPPRTARVQLRTGIRGTAHKTGCGTPCGKHGHTREHDGTPHPRPHVQHGARCDAHGVRGAPAPGAATGAPAPGSAQRHDHFVLNMFASTDACVGQGPVCTADAPQRTAAARCTVPHRALPRLLPPSSLRVLSALAPPACPYGAIKRAPATHETGFVATPARPHAGANRHPAPRSHVHMARGATHTACAARLRPVQRCGAPRSGHAHDVYCELEPQALGRGRGGVACACLAGESGRQASTYLWAGCVCDSPPSGASVRCAGAVRCTCACPHVFSGR